MVIYLHIYRRLHEAERFRLILNPCQSIRIGWVLKLKYGLEMKLKNIRFGLGLRLP